MTGLVGSLSYHIHGYRHRSSLHWVRLEGSD